VSLPDCDQAFGFIFVTVSAGDAEVKLTLLQSLVVMFDSVDMRLNSSERLRYVLYRRLASVQ
jgi:hypothetical protein